MIWSILNKVEPNFKVPNVIENMKTDSKSF